MKVFKDVRFYLGAGLLVVLVSIMWSLPMNADAAADKARDKATDKTADKAPTAPGHIFDKEDSQMEKKRKIKEYLKARYKSSEEFKKKGRPVLIQLQHRQDGSIYRVHILADFTPPGFVAKEGASEDEDLRARARAFQ